jgi:hypothetical protein
MFQEMIIKRGLLFQEINSQESSVASGDDNKDSSDV